MFDLLIKNGTVLTIDDTMMQGRWLGVKDGVIAAIGCRDDAPAAAKQVINLAGKTLLPGLGDSHAHLSLTGIQQASTSLAQITSIADILEIVEDVCAQRAADELAVFTLLPSESSIAEKRFPTRDELDAVSPDNPVLIVHWSNHGGCLNSKALTLANLPPEMRKVREQGIIDQDAVHLRVCQNLYASLGKDVFRKLYHHLGAQAVAKGITSIHSLDGMFVKDDMDVAVLLPIIDELPLNIVPYTQTFDLQKILDWQLPRIGGCLMLDGSGGVFTSCYSKIYPANPNTRGLLNYSDQYLYQFVKKCSENNIQCAFHAIGDRAIDQIIYVYYQVHKELGGINYLRHRIEHFSFPSEDHLAKAAEMELSCNDQPNFGGLFDTPDLNLFAEWVYGEDVNRHENQGRLLRAGVHTSAGTDSPCTPLDPWLSLNFLCNQYNAHRRVSLDDALRLHTIHVAWAAHQEKFTGNLVVGKNADMIITDKNPYQCSADLTQIKVLQTFYKGRSVYQAKA